MGRIEKTVFISYRRTNLPWALAIYQNLTARGYDVFFDYLSINSGDFEQIIIGNIKARAHFLVILTPSALERCDNPGDWLRREIETALDEQRNIIPLFLEGFSFGSPSIAQHLTGKMAYLKNYNGLNVPADYFDEAMERLCSRFLNIAMDAVLHPVSGAIQKAVLQQQIAANKASGIKQTELTAQEWYEKAHRADISSDEEIDCLTQAIQLKPDFATAYNSRGLAHYRRGDFDRAIQDFNEAIRLKPDGSTYFSRGIARDNKGDIEGAIKDYTEAIHLQPDLEKAYYNRGVVHLAQGDMDGAIKDFNDAIRLKPNYADAYTNRGVVRYKKGHLDGAIQDYTRAIEMEKQDPFIPVRMAEVKSFDNWFDNYIAKRDRDARSFEDWLKNTVDFAFFKPDFAKAYSNRGHARSDKGDLNGAIQDYTEALRIKPDNAGVYTSRGILRHRKGDLDGAMKDYSEAIRLKPDSVLAYNNRGVIRLDKGDIDNALEDFTQAIRHKPDLADAYKNRGMLLEKKKRDFHSALANYQKYLDLGGTDKNVESWIRNLKKKIR